MKEDTRTVWGWIWFESLIQDIRYGLRMMRKDTGFTATAVLILGLGIGANSAIFSVVNAVLLRPLPYRNAYRLVQVWETNPRANRWGQWASYPDFLDWRDQNRVFEDIAAFRPWPLRVTGGDHAEMLTGLLVTHNLLSLLGVQPMLGRSFQKGEDEPGHSPIVILNYGFWQRRFGSDPDILGKTVTLDGQKHTVIGVLPPSFGFPRDVGALDAPDVWVPLGTHPERKDRASHNFRVVGRLKPDVSINQAQAKMASVAVGIGEHYPNHRGRSVLLASFQRNATREVRPALLLLLGAIGFVLLIACANIANMQLARATTRQREAAIRQALGASRSRLICQLFTENILVALLSGTMGLLLANWGTKTLTKLAPQIPRLEQTSTDASVVGFTLLTSLTIGILFGLAPAFTRSRTALNEGLKEAGTKSTTGGAGLHTRNLLVVSEMALAIMVLVAATLVIRSFVLLQNVELGFNPQNVLTAYLGSGERDATRGVAFFKDVIERIEALPGVEAAGATSSMPFRANDNGPFQIEGQGDRHGDTVVYAERPKVTPSYLRATGIPLVKGRTFTWADNDNTPLVVVVSEALVRQYWPNEDPVGRRVSIDTQNGKPVWRQIVGVARDTKHDDLAEQARPVIYVPLAQSPLPYLVLAVRGHRDLADLSAAVRREVTSAGPDQPLFQIKTLENVVSDSLSRRRFQTLLLGLFGAVGLILAVVGIYAVMSFSVTQRRRENAIRMALGARQGQVLVSVMRQGLILVLVGTAIGIASSLALSRILSGMLYGITALDPATFTVVPALLIAVALLACYLPARRATRVDPMVALRYE
jgi:putative ABC transport system permease protein